MVEYERSRVVQASPDDVFAFVSDPSNLATFLPTVDTVEPQAEGRVEVHGEVRGRTYEDDGWFQVDAARRRIEWGADERTYSGWLTVAEENGGRRWWPTSRSPPTSRRRDARSRKSQRTNPTRSSKVWRRRSTH